MSKSKIVAQNFFRLIQEAAARGAPLTGVVRVVTNDVPVIVIPKTSVAKTNFAQIAHAIKQQLGIEKSVVSVFGDSQPFSVVGSQVLSQEMSRKLPKDEAVILYGATGRPEAKDGKGRLVWDINGAVTRLIREGGFKAVTQTVDQTNDAIEKWGCETPNFDAKSLAGAIHVAGDLQKGLSVFGDDSGLEGQFDNKLLDPALIEKAAAQKDLPKNIAEILKNYQSATDLKEIDRQQLMHFCVARKIDFTDILKIEDVLLGGISDKAFVGSGGGQSLWQATINSLLGKEVIAIGGLRGAENPKTTIKIVDEDGGEHERHRDFLDAAEIIGFLAYEKKKNPDVDFFTLWEKYFNGDEKEGYPLAGIRLAYNPGNSDVARADELKGGLNSKMRMITASAFAFGCLGGYKHKFDPAKIDAQTHALESLVPYEYAVETLRLAPSLQDPHAGKYHDHTRTFYDDWMRQYAKRTNEKVLTQTLVATLVEELKKRSPVKAVLDIGCGEGQLSAKIAEAASSESESVVDYIGIDSSLFAIGKATQTLSSLAKVRPQFVAGNAFEKLPGEQKVGFAVVSHSGYFAGEKMPNFISEVISRLDKNGLAVFIHDGNSDVKECYKKYSGDSCDPHVSEKIAAQLEALGVKYQTVNFAARIKFPPTNDEMWQAIMRSPAGPVKGEPESYGVTRNLLAFCAQRSLTDLAPSYLLDLVEDVKQMLVKQNNTLFVNSVCQIAIAREHDIDFPDAIAKIAEKLQHELFVKGIPTSELHVHLDGTLEAEMMFQIAQRNGVEFPYKSVEETRAAYSFSDLSDFLNLYFLGAGVMKTQQDFEDLAYAYLKRAHQDGVLHSEMFVGPQTHTVRGVSFDFVMNGTCRAMERAQKDFGITSSLILDFQRDFGRNEATEELKEKVAVEAANKTFDELLRWQKQNPDHAAKVVGVGLDYQETGFPPHWFKDVFERAKTQGLRLTCHAGEEGPAEYVWQAVKDLAVERIDHGNRSVEDEELLRYLAEKKIPFTMCPLSNEALGKVDPAKHPLKDLLDQGIKVTVNSDDPAYFRGKYKDGYIKENFSVIAKALNLKERDIIQLARNSIEASFLAPEIKQQYVLELNQYCNRFEELQKATPKTSAEKLESVPPVNQLVEDKTKVKARL